VPLDLLFRIASTLALAGWIALALSPLQRPLAVFAARAVAAVLCGGYLAVLIHALGNGPAPDWRAFNSLDGVMGLLHTREAFLAGWVHYLAFDLFTGAWEAETAPASRMPHAVLLVCLFLTFMAGPVGLLAYLLIRAGRVSGAFPGRAGSTRRAGGRGRGR
jgi:hypothetical protein